MKFPIAIESGSARSAWGVVVPDLPGCFSAGDTAEQAFANAVEAITLHCEAMAEDGVGIPLARPLDAWQKASEYEGWTWGMVDVGTSRFEGRAKKINITLPGHLLTRIDDYAKLHGTSRSGFLADAAHRAMR